MKVCPKRISSNNVVRCLTSDSTTFFLRNKDVDDESDGEEIGTRMKIRNVLMAYLPLQN